LSGIIIGKLDKLARKADSSRAELIRSLISESLVRKEKEGIELANYGFVKESNSDWDFNSGDGM